MYADKVKLDQQNLVFCFDGDKIGPEATPASLEMEDNDIIEVHTKKTWLRYNIFMVEYPFESWHPFFQSFCPCCVILMLTFIIMFIWE